MTIKEIYEWIDDNELICTKHSLINPDRDVKAILTSDVYKLVFRLLMEEKEKGEREGRKRSDNKKQTNL